MAYSFVLTIDGIALPQVVHISGLRTEVDTIELKQHGADGGYVFRQLMGQQKPGRFTVAQVLSDSTTIREWLTLVMQGDVTGARRTCVVALFDETGQPIRTFTFTDCWVQSIELNTLSAEGSEQVTETFVVCYDESTVT